MKIKKKQQGATMITWLVVAAFLGVTASAVIKVAPYYIEFNSVKSMMKNIAGSPQMKSANMRQINSKIEKHLTVNSLYALEKAYYSSKSSPTDNRAAKTKNPFKITKLKKGKNRRKLTAEYDVPVSWIGNLSFLIKFKHSVVLGEPDTVIEETADKAEDPNRRTKIRLN
jgi:hypothetical protein